MEAEAVRPGDVDEETLDPAMIRTNSAPGDRGQSRAVEIPCALAGVRAMIISVVSEFMSRMGSEFPWLGVFVVVALGAALA